LHSAIEGIEVVEPIPQLRVRLSGEFEGYDVVVDGTPMPVALEIDWKKIIGILVDVLKEGSKPPAKGDGCRTITIKDPDGSTTEIKQCPGSQQA
jgi:hypothetical protein